MYSHVKVQTNLSCLISKGILRYHYKDWCNFIFQSPKSKLTPIWKLSISGEFGSDLRVKLLQTFCCMYLFFRIWLSNKFETVMCVILCVYISPSSETEGSCFKEPLAVFTSLLDVGKVTLDSRQNVSWEYNYM